MRFMVEKMVHDGVPDDMSVQSLFDKATSAKNFDKQNPRILSVTMGACRTTENIPESHDR